MSLVLSRREALAAAGAVAVQGSATFAAERGVQAVAFDAFTIFDQSYCLAAVPVVERHRRRELGAPFVQPWRPLAPDFGGAGK
jgi:hypothetical protein